MVTDRIRGFQTALSNSRAGTIRGREQFEDMHCALALGTRTRDGKSLPQKNGSGPLRISSVSDVGSSMTYYQPALSGAW